MSQEEEEFLEGDNPIPGQNYVCMSFISPDDIMKDKQLYLFNRFMTQRCGEWEKEIDKVMEKSEDKLKNKIERDLREKLKLEFKFTYEQFKSKFDDFKYKFTDELDKGFNEISDYKTSIRGVKVRGVYETIKEAEIKAKQLQKRDRSFHVFVGSVGQWLPWDPCADKIQHEEYLESELNTLMQEYKKNEVNKDMFYEEQKREKKDTALKEKMDADRQREKQEAENKKNMETIENNLESADPWMERHAESTNEVTPEAESTSEVATESTNEVATESTSEVATESTSEVTSN